MKLKNKKRPIRKSWMNNDQRFMIFPFKITKTNTNPNTNTIQRFQIYNESSKTCTNTFERLDPQITT